MVAAKIAELDRKIAALQQLKGQDGRDGKDGLPGKLLPEYEKLLQQFAEMPLGVRLATAICGPIGVSMVIGGLLKAI